MFRVNLIRPEKIIAEQVQKPKPKNGEVLIATKICGICGSDMHAYYGRHPFIKCPIVQGHEFSGTVAELGNKVKGLRIGQKVTAVPHLTCGKCYNCRRGKHNLCKKLKFIGCQATGAMAEFVLAPAEFIMPLPVSIGFEHGALIEPFAVGIHAVKRSKLKKGDSVLIFGAGPIGLMTLISAKSYHACKVIIADLSDHRLNVAKKLGANYTVNAKKIDLKKFVSQKFGEAGVDIIFECVGSEECINNAIDIARKGSTIVVVGVFASKLKMGISLIQDKELNLLGSASYLKQDFKDAIEFVKNRKVNLQPIISRRFRLKDILSAYKLIEKKQDKILKVLIEI